ncbi:hypothetical protein ACFV1L_10505 [Kitasatospora sp. NPDC059646]|uniref:hypothetical protein n=1 Tax=Kitasatospora sp. NPDC059646 TaxID=3346893 RepID=UPI0036C84114
METLQQRRELDRAARELTVEVADRQAQWLWDADGLLVLAGWEASTAARCDVACAEDAHLLVHFLRDPRVAKTDLRSA